ncbi:hypothetical protein [Streptomyces sp. NPDC057428]|uniref:hypothetical protein n=1 Tax=Streptomyces sp. NPDC057428 TaxID=3346129 RepID=UPI00368A15AA
MSETWVVPELDVRLFDADRWAPYTERCRSAGLRLTTFAELGDSAENRRPLYELNSNCAAVRCGSHGVRREHRGAGVAVAMKVHGMGFAGLCGVHRVRTMHHAANTKAITMNRMLGCADADRQESED